MAVGATGNASPPTPARGDERLDTFYQIEG